MLKRVVPAAALFVVITCAAPSGPLDCFGMRPPRLDVTYPADGDCCVVGSFQSIVWGVEGVSTVRIELSRDGGVSWETLVDDAPASVSCPPTFGEYLWYVTDGGQGFPQTECMVRLSDSVDGLPSDTSELFTIRDVFAWRVDIDAPSGGDGLSWGTAFQHPQDAADVALWGDEVWVAEGTYTSRDSFPFYVLAMGHQIRVYGGFAGTEASRDERDWSSRVTTLDGEGTVYHVVIVDGRDARLDGFTITGGSAVEGGVSGNCGGGMQVWSWSGFALANCTFASNWANEDGGAMYSRGAWHTVTNCIFLSNGAAGNGGALYGDARFMNCTFTGNTAQAGGAIHADGGVVATNCILWGDAAADGPEIHVAAGGACTVTYSDIQGGFAGTGNIDSDPLFVDAANDDLHLQTGSPCIDTGTPFSAPDHDLDGNPRPAGSGYDMGSYEHQP